MDAKGDLTQPRELQKKYPGRVFLCEYRLDRKTLQFVSWGKDREFGSVIADRSRMIQYVIEEFIMLHTFNEKLCLFCINIRIDTMP